MAMFEFKDSEDISLTGCHTDAEQLVKGEGVKRLEVSESSAFSAKPVSPPTGKRTLFRFLSEHLVISICSVPAALFVGYLIFKFGWTG